MKVEQFIVQYLYNNKRVSIPDIGVFSIVSGTIMPVENDKDNTLPPGSIEFEYNTRAEKDEGLIDFIVAESRKIRPLATSDLESYIILSRQFLNIGKPLVIDGLGTLIKNQQGTYDFTQGLVANPRLESKKVEIKEKIQEDISFSSPAKTAPTNKILMLVLATLLLLSIAAALYYFLVYNKKTATPLAEETATLNVDSNEAGITTSTVATSQDSSTNNGLNKDSLAAIASNTAAVAPADGYTFKVQIKRYDSREAADRAYNRLTSYGHKLLLRQKDSSSYQVLMPFNTSITDTARAKDSVRILFGGKPVVELK